VLGAPRRARELTAPEQGRGVGERRHGWRQRRPRPDAIQIVST
jgi:hypothetical protein